MYGFCCVTLEAEAETEHAEFAALVANIAELRTLAYIFSAQNTWDMGAHEAGRVGVPEFIVHVCECYALCTQEHAHALFCAY